jgi:hypothetical protein
VIKTIHWAGKYLIRSTKRTLYVLFVDFSKAYDFLPRNTLLDLLTVAGCGGRMLRAIGESLRITGSAIGNEIFYARDGVRQGGSSSCFIFTFFANPLIRAIKSCGPDGWLGSLSGIMLMDDTVDSYCYLGALISDNTIRQQVQLETRNRAVHERKFTSFLTSNRDAPYPVKLTVWRSAMLSALTYGI